MQGKPINFKVIESEEFIIKDSGSILQLTFKKLPLVEFGYSIKEYPQLSEKTIQMFLLFLPTYLWEAGFSLPTSTKTTYHNRLTREADMSLAIFS